MSEPNAEAIHAIIPAAGSGLRFGAPIPKQYTRLGGKTILERSIEKLLLVVDQVILALAEDDQYWPELPLAHDPRIQVVTGGGSRSESVNNALQALGGAAPDDWVLIHDAVRPLVTEEDLQRLISELENHDAGGLLAAPIHETVKRADELGKVAKTEDRTGLWIAQTPQMFRYGKLIEAIKSSANDESITDESLAMEQAGYSVQLVEGSKTNIKITLQGDLKLAEILISQVGD